MKLQDVVKHNKKWFDKGNQKFFQDKSYSLQLGSSGKAYLIREMAGWSDMFDGEKKWHYRINPVSEDYKILPLVLQTFVSRAEVQEYLNAN